MNFVLFGASVYALIITALNNTVIKISIFVRMQRFRDIIVGYIPYITNPYLITHGNKLYMNESHRAHDTI